MIERFAHPFWLWLLLALPLLLAWRWKGPGSRRLALTVSGTAAYRPQSGHGWTRLRHLPFALRLAGLALLVLALARPQFGTHTREVTSEGVDIVLAIDISTSMAGEDFRPNNRLQEAKAQAERFIEMREQDRIGLVVFARQAYTQCPLTLDHDMLGELAPGGQLAANGAVSYMFNRKGIIAFETENIDFDALFEAALEAGAEDVAEEGSIIEVITEPGDFADVLEALQAGGFEQLSAEVLMIPENTVSLENEKTGKVLRLIDRLEDNDDVQSVASNLDIPEDFEMPE